MSQRTAPTLDDVARAAGVSRATASRVVNGVVPVSQPAAEAVRRAKSRCSAIAPTPLPFITVEILRQEEESRLEWLQVIRLQDRLLTWDILL